MPHAERTLLLIKPEAIKRNINFEIADRFEKRSFVLVACRMLQPSRELAESHYAHLKGGAAFDTAIAGLLGGAVIAMVWEAPAALAVAFSMVGHVDPAQAEHGTIRGDFALSSSSNLVEVSADEADAKRSISLWFSPSDFNMSTAPCASTCEASGSAEADAEAAPSDKKSKGQLKKEAKKAEKSSKKESNKKASAGIPEVVEAPKVCLGP